jgi:hypothetical protein
MKFIESIEAFCRPQCCTLLGMRRGHWEYYGIILSENWDEGHDLPDLFHPSGCDEV